MSGVDPWQSGLAIVVLIAITLAAATLAEVRVRGDVLVAVGRATLQLVLVALVIAWVFRHPEGVVLYLGVMLIAATITSTRRIRSGRHLAPYLALAIGFAALCATVPVLASGALELQSQTIVPFAAQIIGGSMTAASLAGSRLRDDVHRDWGQVEAGLSIGLTPGQAVADFGRVAVSRSLIPAIDQTRSAGLVTLPGAFVGMLLGGATPAEAAEVQLLVLVGLLAAEMVSATLTVRLLGPVFGTARPAAVG